ncbi:plasmid mobilization protein [Lentilactobacillus parabuchneri]|uniref:plasmid mobilization protein n=1 Tax=Lentilactobacillus parabuchneri TaxID=152331 RepID=UPI001C4DEFB3|nr:plasmid mobilization relaxosome protein MobC [Lentilactobacillus parabuchneri]MBW0246849.1 MobC family plasmid mobilization relaxosome protein [Lentilactobacillus parabuchneri]
MANIKADSAKQTKRINFRLTGREYEKLKKSANTYGLTVSNYAKQLALKSKLRKPYFSASDTRKIILELTRQGNNINQIARNINQNDSLKSAMLIEISEIQEEQKKLWQQLQK